MKPAAFLCWQVQGGADIQLCSSRLLASMGSMGEQCCYRLVSKASAVVARTKANGQCVLMQQFYAVLLAVVQLPAQALEMYQCCSKLFQGHACDLAGGGM